MRGRYLTRVSPRLAAEPLFQGSFLELALKERRLTKKMLHQKLNLLKGLEKMQKGLPYFLLSKEMVHLKMSLEAELGLGGKQ